MTKPDNNDMLSWHIIALSEDPFEKISPYREELLRG